MRQILHTDVGEAIGKAIAGASKAPTTVQPGLTQGLGNASLAPKGAVTSGGTANAASGARLKAQLAQQEILGSTPTGSALKGGGPFSPRTFGRNLDVDHRAAAFLQDTTSQGQHFTVRGAGGVARNLTQVPASVNGRQGIVEFLVGPKGLEHQRFIPGGRITGTVNQVPGRLP